jgi:hypothetical protein
MDNKSTLDLFLQINKVIIVNLHVITSKDKEFNIISIINEMMTTNRLVRLELFKIILMNLKIKVRPIIIRIQNVNLAYLNSNKAEKRNSFRYQDAQKKNT